MIQTASKNPPLRKHEIEQNRQLAGYDQSGRMHTWGVTVAREMSKVVGRVLDPPRLTYHPTSIVRSPPVAQGTWNLTRSKFLTPGAPLESWSVLNLSRAPPLAVKNFVTALVRVCRGKGTLRHHASCITEMNA